MRNVFSSWDIRPVCTLGGLGLAISLMFTTGIARAEGKGAAESAVTPAAKRTVTLAGCIEIALGRQPSLAASRATLAAAETQLRALNNIPGRGLLIARDLPIRRRQASLGIAAAEGLLTQTEHETMYAVQRTYYSIVYANLQLKVADDVVANLRFYQERVSEAVKKGQSREWTTNTVDKITVYLGLAETKRAEAQRGVELATAALREAMGVGCDFGLTPADTALPFISVMPNRHQIIDLALCRRGELTRVGVAADVTGLEIDAQSRSFRPKAITYAAVADVHATLIPAGTSDGEYRPGALPPEMPTTLVGRRSDRMERARDFSDRAAAVIDKTRNLITLEATDAYLRWKETSDKVARTRDAATAGGRLAANTREDFRSDQKVKIEDVLTNEVLAGQARSSANEALYQNVLALAALERVTAGGFPSGLGARK